MKSNDPRIIGALLMFDNLNETVRVAGGCAFNWNQLENMTAADLLIKLGCNQVRFVNKYVGAPRHEADPEMPGCM